MSPRAVRAITIGVLVAAVLAIVAAFKINATIQREADRHAVIVIGDPTLADGPQVLAGLRRDAAGGFSAPTPATPPYLLAALLPLIWLMTGVAIMTRQPGNKAGWVLLAIGTAWIVGNLSQAIVVWDARAYPGTVPFRDLVALVGENALVPMIALPLLFLLFPDGRPPSPGWRWVVAGLLAGGGLVSVGQALNPGPLNNFVTSGVLYVNPAGLDALASVAPAMIGVGTIVALGSSIASVFGVRSRFRRSTGETRQQLRWLVTVATLALVLLLIGIALTVAVPEGASGMAPWAFNAVLIFLVATIALGTPASYLIAVYRYGLWDLDVVIKKTVVFGVVVVGLLAIGGLVATLVVWGVFPSLYDTPPLFLLLGAVFGLLAFPLYRAASRVADRVVYGGRATPYEVLTEFSGRVGETYASDDVLQRMAAVLGEGTGAESATVWLRFGGDLAPAATWPTDITPTPEAPGDAVEVLHQGEALGALSVTMPANDPMNPVRERLVRDLAAQAGPVLRNVRLIEELRASRQRLVAAQDEERRKLERNIHDGVQQQLVALNVQLGLLARVAERDPAKVPELAGDLQTRATETLEDLRDLARGIYPPLLADQGLVAALEAQVRKASLPVTLAPDGVGRYGREVEATIYFCTLEALNNVAKYAQATAATVELGETDGMLTFVVRDDGAGFDRTATSYGTGLQGMADRLEAVGGSLNVTSTVGSGTTVAGRVPVGPRGPR